MRDEGYTLCWAIWCLSWFDVGRQQLYSAKILETYSLEVLHIFQHPDHMHMHVNASLLVKIFGLKEHIPNIFYQHMLRERNSCMCWIKMGFEQCLWSFDDNKVWKKKLDMLMCVQVCRTIESNFDTQSQVLVLKYQDSERIWKHLKQMRSLNNLEQDLKKCQT